MTAVVSDVTLATTGAELPVAVLATTEYSGSEMPAGSLAAISSGAVRPESGIV